MESNHEIKKLEFNIKGQLPSDVQRTISELVPALIESCFNRFSDSDKDILIDKIELNLGTIPSDNFVEELKIKLTYLLQTEFQKFFAQPNIYQELEENALMSKAEAFVLYLERGYSTLDQVGLSELFEHLLIHNIALLRELMTRMAESPLAMQRIFYQIPYQSLERFWIKVYPNTYKKIRWLVDVILAETGYSLTKGQDKGGMVDFLKKMIFEYMNRPLNPDQPARGFVELLKINVDELKNHEHDLKTSAFQYLDYLTIRVTNLGDDTISQQNKKESAIEAIVSFLITGRKGKGFTTGAITRKRSEEDWEQIIAAFVTEPTWDKSSFQRLVSLLPQYQLEYLVNQISKTGNTLQKERIRKIDYFRLLVKELFGEDIYTLNPQSLFTLITSDSSEKTDVKNQIQFYLELVAAKKQDAYGKLLERLKTRADKSIHNEAKVLQNTLLQLQKELAQKNPPESKIPRDLMGAYMYFLKYGLWVLEGHSPQEVLRELLSKNKEHLIAELTRHLNIQVIWLRIIYQHGISDITTLFQGVFEEAHFQLVMAKLKQYESEKLGVFHQRRLFEAFIHAVFLKQENETLSFEEVFQGLVEDLSNDLPGLSSEESLGSVDQTQEFLTRFLKLEISTDKPNREQKARLVRDLLKNPHKIASFIYDQSIEPSGWTKFLRLFDRNELFDLFRVMAGLRQRQISWMPSLLYFIDNYTIQPALTKVQLLQLIPLLITDTEVNRQAVLSLLAEALKAKDSKLEEALSRSLPELRAMETPVWTSLNAIEFAEGVSAKNLEKYIEEVEKLRVQLQQEGLVFTHSRFKEILLDILPFAENAQMLRSSFISKLKEEFPYWADKIKGIARQEIEPIPYKSFAHLVAQSIAQGKVVYQVYFNTSLDFERYLLQAYEYSGEVKAVFLFSNPHKVLGLISQLSKGTLQQFDEYIQKKFIQSEYIKIRQRIIDSVPTAEREILQASIAYGVTNRAFSTFDFLRFINESLPEAQAYPPNLLENIGLSASELVPRMYVEAFIHYLKYDRYIYLYVEKDGPEEAINKVFSYYPDLFLQELSTEPNASQIAERLFQHIANEKQLKLFSGLVGQGEDYVASVIAEVQASIKSHPSLILTHWLILIISNNPRAGNRAELTQLLLSALSKKKQAIKESTSWVFAADQALPISILAPEFVSGNVTPTPEQLLKEVTQSGQIPIWLKGVSRDKLPQLLLAIAKQLPVEFGKLLRKHLKEIAQVQRLQQVVGRKNLEALLKISDSVTLQQALDSVKQLSQLHQSYGNKQALADYFFVRYLAFYYKYLAGDISEQGIMESVIEAFIFDFGVNRADYRLMLEESKSPMAQEYIRIHGYSERDADTELLDEAYRINLLFYIARENRLPWWVKKREERKEPVDKQLIGLLTDLLERNPKQLIRELLRTPNKGKLLQRIVPLLSSEQFFTILLILSPNFGGFIVSFTILIQRARLTTDQKFTYPFIINYLIDNPSFNPSDFIGRAIPFIAAQSHKPQPKLRAQLQAVVSAAIKEGEMRFLPFVDLLKENAVSPQAVDSPVLKEVKPLLSSGKKDEIELLIQLLLENKAPRWAEKYQGLSARQIGQEIKVLSAHLIKQKPKEWIEAVISHPEKQKIIQRWNKRIDSTQINEAIVALSSSLGGFIISFAEVLSRSKLPIAQAEWLGFVFEFLTKRQNFEASDFVQSAISFLSRALKRNRIIVKEELQVAAQKASQKGEKRFAPVLDLLADFSADTASSEEEIEEKRTERETEKEPLTYTFIDSVVYYLQTGAIPQNTYTPIGHYAEFIQAMERYVQLGHNELKLAIAKALTQPKVRKRILREESEFFIQVILRVIFPKEADEILAYKSQLLPHLQKKFETVSEQGLGELFYLQIFEQEIEKPLSAFHAPSFIASFVQFAAHKLNKVITFEREELEKWGIEKPLLELLLGKEQIQVQKPKPQKKPTQKREEPKPDAPLVDHRVLIKNAGVVMVWPFLSRYFDMLQMLESGKFKSEEEAIRAVHLIQYIATGTTSAPEHALLLNKVLCGLAVATPVPLEVELSTKEIETTQMMLKGLLQNWERIKSSSVEALREGFLTRDGYMLEKEKLWELKVEKKTLDILMKDLPWAIGTIKLPWMEKRLVVEWL